MGFIRVRSKDGDMGYRLRFYGVFCCLRVGSLDLGR